MNYVLNVEVRKLNVRSDVQITLYEGIRGQWVAKGWTALLILQWFFFTCFVGNEGICKCYVCCIDICAA